MTCSNSRACREEYVARLEAALWEAREVLRMIGALDQTSVASVAARQGVKYIDAVLENKS